MNRFGKHVFDLAASRHSKLGRDRVVIESRRLRLCRDLDIARPLQSKFDLNGLGAIIAKRMSPPLTLIPSNDVVLLERKVRSRRRCLALLVNNQIVNAQIDFNLRPDRHVLQNLLT